MLTRRVVQHGRGVVSALLWLIVLGGIAAGVWFYRDYRRFADTPLSLSKEITIDVPLGTPFRSIVRKLERDRLTSAPALYWRALAEEMRVANGLHAGEYSVPLGTTPRRLLERMAQGDVVQHRFTIVEGWTFRQLREQLALHTGLAATLGTVTDDDVMAKIDAPGEMPEGRFLPETYAYVKGTTDVEILRRAHDAMTAALAQAWERRLPDLPFSTPYEALILASIVERETGVPGERPEIAGVFVRRLRLGMRLQTDPTVIYGLGATYDGNLRRRDLDADTPYNTYTRGGLPPTPIAMPGKAALDAAVRPADGRALYFVARGDGSHQFSATLDEHNRAVARFQLRHGP